MEAEIGIIGGSGFYSLLKDAKTIRISTKYGETSDAITIGTIGGRKVAFLPRHGSKHTIPPHKVPYRANIEALKSLGVKRIIATNAVGSLRPDYKPGEIAIFDQFVNMTHGRHDTFFDEDTVAHISTAHPYCAELRTLAAALVKKNGIPVHESGTIVVINGPRFSTKAESKFFSSQGFDMIGMTQYPEVTLAREHGICYLGIGVITDYDAGLEGREDIKPVTMEEVMMIFSQNMDKTKKVVTDLIPEIPAYASCSCSKSLDGAIQTQK